MIQHRACPRCNGSIAHDRDQYGERIRCIQCGASFETVPVDVLTPETSPTAPVHEWNGFHRGRDPNSKIGYLRSYIDGIAPGETRVVPHKEGDTCADGKREFCHVMTSLRVWRHGADVRVTGAHIDDDVHITAESMAVSA